jgi:hypothetical protein
MFLVTALATALILYGIGRFLFRRLGWPTDAEGAGRWGLTLLGSAVLLVGLPNLLDLATKKLGPLPSVNLGEVIPALGVLGLAVLGYVAWSRGAAARENERDAAERARFQVRRPALPPPPQATRTEPVASDGVPEGRARFVPVERRPAEDVERE